MIDISIEQLTFIGKTIVCPNCGSGKGKKHTGLFRNPHNGTYHCFVCGSNYRLKEETTHKLNTYRETYQEILTFSNSKTVINYLKTKRGVQRFLSNIYYETNRGLCIPLQSDFSNGYQELLLDETNNKLIKLFSKGANTKKETLIIGEKLEKELYIVESFVNAFTLLEFGLSSIVIYSSSNYLHQIELLRYKYSDYKIISCLDLDVLELEKKYHIDGFLAIDELMNAIPSNTYTNTTDINDIYLIDKQNFLSKFFSCIIREEEEEKELEFKVEKESVNLILAPTGTGKTYFVKQKIKEDPDKKKLVIFSSKTNLFEFNEDGYSYITNTEKKIDDNADVLLLLHKRLCFNNYKAYDYLLGSKEEIQQYKHIYVDECDLLIEHKTLSIFKILEKRNIYYENVRKGEEVIIENKNQEEILERGVAYPSFINYYESNNFLVKKLDNDVKEIDLLGLTLTKDFLLDYRNYTQIEESNLFFISVKTNVLESIVNKEVKMYSMYNSNIEYFLNLIQKTSLNIKIYCTFPLRNKKPISYEEYEKNFYNLDKKTNDNDYFEVFVTYDSVYPILKLFYIENATYTFLSGTADSSFSNAIEYLSNLTKKRYIKKEIVNHRLANSVITILKTDVKFSKKGIKGLIDIAYTFKKKCLVVFNKKNEAENFVKKYNGTFLLNQNNLESEETNYVYYINKEQDFQIIVTYGRNANLRGANFLDVDFIIIDGSLFAPKMFYSSMSTSEEIKEVAKEHINNLLIQILGRTIRKNFENKIAFIYNSKDMLELSDNNYKINLYNLSSQQVANIDLIISKCLDNNFDILEKNQEYIKQEIRENIDYNVDKQAKILNENSFIDFANDYVFFKFYFNDTDYFLTYKTDRIYTEKNFSLSFLKRFFLTKAIGFKTSNNDDLLLEYLSTVLSKNISQNEIIQSLQKYQDTIKNKSISNRKKKRSFRSLDLYNVFLCQYSDIAEIAKEIGKYNIELNYEQQVEIISIFFANNQEKFQFYKTMATIADLSILSTPYEILNKLIYGKDSQKESIFNESNVSIGDIKNIFPEFSNINENFYYNDVLLNSGGFNKVIPGVYHNVVSIDIDSAYPNAIIALNYFNEYTKNFKLLLELKKLQANSNFDSVKEKIACSFGKTLSEDELKVLKKYFKLFINMTYGYIQKKSNVNLVSLYVSSFMLSIANFIEQQGYKIVHIQTDSIKIIGCTDDLLESIQNYAKKYLFSFKIEQKYTELYLFDSLNSVGIIEDSNIIVKGNTALSLLNILKDNKLYFSNKTDIFLSENNIHKNVCVYAVKDGFELYTYVQGVKKYLSCTKKHKFSLTPENIDTTFYTSYILKKIKLLSSKIQVDPNHILQLFYKKIKNFS